MPSHCRAIFELVSRRLPHLFRECAFSKSQNLENLAIIEPLYTLELEVRSTLGASECI
jgi:hypothetical protein